MSNQPRRKQPQAAGTAAPATAHLGADGLIHDEIQLRAYYRYCERGGAPGGELDDWLAAEQAVLARQNVQSSAKAG